MKKLALLIALIFCCRGFAQDVHPQPRFGKSDRSPEVGLDGRVTFRFSAPNAKAVFVVLEGAPNVALVKDERGVWSGTTGVLAPDLYSYSFVVDGVALGDPANPMFKPVATGGVESIVEVAGNTK